MRELISATYNTAHSTHYNFTHFFPHFHNHSTTEVLCYCPTFRHGLSWQKLFYLFTAIVSVLLYFVLFTYTASRDPWPFHEPLHTSWNRVYLFVIAPRTRTTRLWLPSDHSPSGNVAFARSGSMTGHCVQYFPLHYITLLDKISCSLFCYRSPLICVNQLFFQFFVESYHATVT